MSWKMAGAVKPLKCGRSGQQLLVSEKLTLLILAEYYNDERQCAWVSVRRLADECLCSERTLYRVLESLENIHKLVRVDKNGEGRNIYRLFFGSGTDNLSSPDNPKTGSEPPDTDVRQTTKSLSPVTQNDPAIYIESYEPTGKEEKKEPAFLPVEIKPQTEAPCRNCGEIGRHTCPGGSPKFRRKERREKPARFSPSTEAPKPEVIKIPPRTDTSLNGFYRGLRLLFKERTGKSLGDLGRESGEVLAEACARHGPEAIEKGFVAWLDAKADYARTRDRPGMLFIYSIEDWVAEAQVVHEKPVSRVPELTR